MYVEFPFLTKIGITHAPADPYKQARRALYAKVALLAPHRHEPPRDPELF